MTEVTEVAQTNYRAALYKKLLETQKMLEPLEKSGRNDFHKYSYATAGDVLVPVSRACNANGLIIVADVVDSNIEQGKAWVTVRVTVADADTGETITASAPGYADDKGDKAVYKAITGATKYAVRSFFCLPSEDDPERSPKPSASTSNSNNPKINREAIVSKTNQELKRLGWTPADGKIYLESTYGKTSRQQLSNSELLEFSRYLEYQNSPAEVE